MAASSTTITASPASSYLYSSINLISEEEVTGGLANGHRVFFKDLLNRPCYTGWELNGEGCPVFSCRLCQKVETPDHSTLELHVNRLDECRRICWEGQNVPIHREISEAMESEEGRKSLATYKTLKKCNKSSSEYNGCVMSVGFFAFMNNKREQQQRQAIPLPPGTE